MKPRLCIVTSVAESISVLLRGQPRALQNRFDVSLVTSPGPRVDALREQEGLDVHTFSMSRRITPGGDLATVRRLARFFEAHQPQVVQTYTPKAGLLGMLAAWRARVPHRIHGIVGMPLMEATGAKRRLLTATERTTYAAATHLTCNSHGLRRWVHAHLTRRPIAVVGAGSINGIDTAHWSPSVVQGAREDLGLDPEDIVLVFVGRLVRDKGVTELIDAFRRVRGTHPRARLLLVGHEEPDLDPLPEETRAQMTGDSVVRTGFVDDVRPLLAAADVFVLPSYREGLPNSLLEAGAMGLPAIATDINGCNEVVIPGHTGLLVPVGSPDRLAEAMDTLLGDAEGRRTMGDAARASVAERYDQVAFWRDLLAYYDEVLAGGR